MFKDIIVHRPVHRPMTNTDSDNITNSNYVRWLWDATFLVLIILHLVLVDLPRVPMSIRREHDVEFHLLDVRNYKQGASITNCMLSGLVQFTAVWCAREPAEEGAVGVERRCCLSTYQHMVPLSHLSGVASASFAAGPETSGDCMSCTPIWLLCNRSPAMDSLGNVWNHIYLEPRNDGTLWVWFFALYKYTYLLRWGLSYYCFYGFDHRCWVSMVWFVTGG